MKSFIRILLVLCSYQVLAQDNIENQLILNLKQNRSEKINVRGPVKSVHWFYSHVSDSLKYRVSLEKAQEDIMYFNRDIGGSIMTFFDDKGKPVKRISRNKNWMEYRKQPLDEKYAINYQYDEKDLILKNKIRLSSYPAFPIYNSHLVPQPDFMFQQNIYDNGGLAFLYRYTLDANKRIKSEKFYLISEPKGFSVKEEDLMSTTKFIYDAKGNVVKQNITPGKLGREMPFTAMETESSYCSDLHFSYKYDKENRITKMEMFGCEEVVLTEIYNYHPSKNYISEIEITFNSELRSRVYITKKTVLYYDEFGNIIEKKYFKNVPQQRLGEFFDIPESTYYKYQYDKYNNWYRCDIYMQGKDGPVTATIDREIEYYKKTE